LPRGLVTSVEQVACTCLLSPRCFHVLACLTQLTATLDEPADVDEEGDAAASLQAPDDTIEVNDNQHCAARTLVASLAQMLRIGVANAGIAVQSGILRSIHQCRAEGLHRLAALGLRVIAGVNEIRNRAASADPAQLAEDVADALETSRHVLAPKAVPSYWIGTARRKQLPVRPRKLHGLFAEPILTRSGFAGAAAYFLGEDEQIYTASDVRPGEAQLARDAYHGGIEMGPLIQPARQFARGLYLGTDMTASLDGRLGRGKLIKIVEQGTSTWQGEPIRRRFERPLAEQWNAVYAHAVLPADARPAGWDFVFVTGTVLGAVGPELLFHSPAHGVPLRLAIANDSQSLMFRENLRMLCHAPGLPLQVIARVNLQDPRVLAPLAIAAGQTEESSATPKLDVPQSLAGRICLGFDEIQRNWLIGAQAMAMVLGEAHLHAGTQSPLELLRRRWIAAMLSGLSTQRSSNVSSLRAEAAMLHRNGFTTGAMLLDSLVSSQSDFAAAPRIDSFLATAVYLRNCSGEFAKSVAGFEG
jgi:hypothetical protein